MQGDLTPTTAETVETPAPVAPTTNDANPFPFEAAFGAPSGLQGFATVPTDTAPVEGSATPSASKLDGIPDVATATPAPEGTDGAASDPAPSRRLSIREQQEADHARDTAEMQTRIDAALRERDEAQAAAQAATAAQEARDATERERLAAYESVIGPEGEYQRRARLVALEGDPNYYGERLTTEEREELGRWTATRDLRQPFMADADRTAAVWVDEQLGGQRRVWVSEALAVADEIGLPRAELSKPENANLGRLLKLASDTTAARIRATEVAPLAERLSQHETHIQGLEASVYHAQRSPVVGGIGDGGGLPGPSTGWDPLADWAANLGRPVQPPSETRL